MYTNFSDTERSPDKNAYLLNNFLMSQPKHMLWVLKKSVSLRRFFGIPNK